MIPVLMIAAALQAAQPAAPAAVPAAPAPAAAAPAATPSPAMAAAIANKARVATPPTFKVEPASVRPEEALRGGEFGDVVLFGIIGEDGRMREAVVRDSSRSAVIDAAALASVPAMLFEPARDAEGHALAVPARIAREYLPAKFHGAGSVAEYRCDQFVRDYDWWYRIWHGEREDRVYKTMRGFAAVQDISSGTRGGPAFEAEWKAAIAACRSAPDALMVDKLKPHGELFRGMMGGRE